MTPGFPAEVEEAAAEAAASPRLPDLDRTDLELVTIDPASAMDLDQALHLERDGDGFVVHYAIADVAAFVDARRPGRPGGSPPRRDAVRRRLQGPAPPEGDLRGRRLAAAGPGATGAALDDPGRRHRRGHRRHRRARPGPLPREARLRRGASAGSTTAAPRSRCSCSRRSASCDWSARPPAAGSRCRCPSRRSTLDGDDVALHFRSHAAGRAVERPDLAADRLRRRVADGLRAGRPAAHPAAAGPARRDPAAPHRTRARHRVAGRAALPRLHPRPRPEPARARRDGRRLHPAAAGERVRRLRRRDARRAAALRAGLRVRPRHRAAASPRRPLRRRGLRRAVRRRGGAAAGCSRSSTGCPTRCASRRRGPTATSAPCSTWSRPSCCSTGSARASPGSSSTSTTTTTRAARSPSRTPPSRPGSSGTDDLPLGDDVTVTLATADPVTRKVEFTLA